MSPDRKTFNNNTPGSADSLTREQAGERLGLSDITDEPVLIDPVGEGEPYSSKKAAEEDNTKRS